MSVCVTLLTNCAHDLLCTQGALKFKTSLVDVYFAADGIVYSKGNLLHLRFPLSNIEKQGERKTVPTLE